MYLLFFQGAGGVGKVLADWIVDDRPPGNLLDFEATRFTNLHNNLRFLTERSREVVGRHYQLQYPYVHEFKTARKIRTSSLFSELEARGAVFGQKMGWERPLWARYKVGWPKRHLWSGRRARRRLYPTGSSALIKGAMERRRSRSVGRDLSRRPCQKEGRDKSRPTALVCDRRLTRMFGNFGPYGGNQTRAIKTFGIRIGDPIGDDLVA